MGNHFTYFMSNVTDTGKFSSTGASTPPRAFFCLDRLTGQVCVPVGQLPSDPSNVILDKSTGKNTESYCSEITKNI